jgi:hypothetical protein
MAGITQPRLERIEGEGMYRCPTLVQLWLVALVKIQPNENLLACAFALLDCSHPARRN